MDSLRLENYVKCSSKVKWLRKANLNLMDGQDFIPSKAKLFSSQKHWMSHSSIVGTVSHYGLDNQGVSVWVLVGSRIFISPYYSDRFWGPSSLLSNEYQGLFPRGVKG
jgi:hypothetical protein